MAKRGRFEAKAPVSSDKQRNTDNRLLLSFATSITSLMLCCTMFFGTTMAWFSDTVTSSGNQITIGTLEMAVLCDGEPLGDRPIFGNSRKPWAANSFEVRTLTIQNKGSLDLTYTLNLLLETGAENNNTDIAKYLEVYVNPDGEVKEFDTKNWVNQGWKRVGNENIRTLADIFTEGWSVAKGSLKAGTKENPTVETFAIALYMTEDLDSKLQGTSLKLNVKLDAHQSNMPNTQNTDPVVIDDFEEEEEPVESSETTENSEPVQESSEPTGSSVPTQSSEPTESSQPTEGSEPTESSEPAESSEPTGESSEPTQNSEPAETGDAE